MLKAIAIDDEPIALDIIKNFCAKIFYISPKAFFHNAFEAISFLEKEEIDLAFLDIKMPGISGIDFLKYISKPPMVIFTTAYSEHAIRGFELNAIDYLLKPFSFSRFLNACNKAHEQYKLKIQAVNFSEGAKHIFIRTGYEQMKVNLDELLYIECKGNYVEFVLEKATYLTRLTMNEAEALLSDSQFIRIHRSYIIASKHISKISKSSIWIGQIEIPLGAAFLNNLKNAHII